MTENKFELDRKIKTHCENVMAELVTNAGTAGALVSRFVCIPDKRGDCDDLLDVYFERKVIEEKLKTSELTPDLMGLSVDARGGLLYSICFDVGDEQEPGKVGHCFVDKSAEKTMIDWDYINLELL
jgi:hypothetical protein